MANIDRTNLSSTQIAAVDALIASNGDFDAAATALDVTKNALKGRLRRMNVTVDDVLASNKPAKPATKASSGDGNVYVRDDGPFKVINGTSRQISVATDHPAAVAGNLTQELGGRFEATPSGLKLYDSQDRLFATVLAAKETVDFYCERVSHATAISVADDLGDWSYCWPKKKAGCARLVKASKVTKTMLRTIMKMHATHAVDRRTKEHRNVA